MTEIDKARSQKQRHDVATPYFIAQFFTAISLSTPHAILTPLLLGKGLTISQILIMQAAFSVSVLVFEFPSGAIADMFSRRKLYLLSRIIFSIFFLLVILGQSFPTLLIAWIIYGFANALDSGTLDAALVNNAKTRFSQENSRERRISWLVKKESQNTFLGMMVGSSVGALLYASVGVNIYFFSIAMVFLAITSIVIFFKIPEQYSQSIQSSRRFSSEVISHSKITIAEMRQSQPLRDFLLLAILLQALMQLHMQLWQALALEKGCPEEYLIILYLAFMLMSYFGAHMPIERLLKDRRLLFIGAAVFIPCGFFIYSIEGMYYTIFYGTSVFALIVMSNYCLLGVRKFSSIERIGAITSLVSVCGRVGSVSVLILASALLHFYSTTAVLSGGFSIISVLVLLLLGLRLARNTSI